MVQQFFLFVSTAEHIVGHMAVDLVCRVSVPALEGSFEGAPRRFNALSVHTWVGWVHEVNFMIDPFMVVTALQLFYSTIGRPTIRNYQGS